MKKPSVVHVCQQCGHQSPKWLGKCPACGEWNSFIEERPGPAPHPERAGFHGERPVPITEVAGDEAPRRPCGIGELDRLLGGGIVVGSVVLLGGDPGVGKSTLLLQVADRVARGGATVLYVSAEESIAQTKLRAGRLGVAAPSLLLSTETDLDRIRTWIDSTRPALVVVDSIQMVNRAEVPSSPGTVTQVRECTTELVYVAKRSGAAIFVIGHVTKDGMIAGPRTLEHLVDTVLYFEGDRFQSFRILRAVKNRFGSTNEIAVFEMRKGGLVEVENPSRLFLSASRRRGGSVVVPTLIGTRTLLVEVQALASRSSYGTPARRVTGVDGSRLAMLLAVLEKRAGLRLGGDDVFVNAVGGVELSEPAADLGIAVAVAASFRNRDLPVDLVISGEVGLGGEVRAVSQASARLAEAARMGFRRAILPADNRDGLDVPTGIALTPVESVREAIRAAVGGDASVEVPAREGNE